MNEADNINNVNMNVHSIVVHNINVLCLSLTGDNISLNSIHHIHTIVIIIKETS